MARASKIRSVLQDAGLVTSEEWSAACTVPGHPAGNLVRQQVLSEAALLEALGQAASVAPVDLSRVQPDAEAVQALPREVCEEHSVLPLAKNGDLLTVAVNDPFIPVERAHVVGARFRELGKPCRMKIYPGADHGFFCDERSSHDAAAADDAWRELTSFFAEHLKRERA